MDLMCLMGFGCIAWSLFWYWRSLLAYWEDIGYPGWMFDYYYYYYYPYFRLLLRISDNNSAKIFKHGVNPIIPDQETLLNAGTTIRRQSYQFSDIQKSSRQIPAPSILYYSINQA